MQGVLLVITYLNLISSQYEIFTDLQLFKMYIIIYYYIFVYLC